MKPYSGLIVTSFSKSDEKKISGNLLPLLDAYNTYKKITGSPTEYNGNHFVRFPHKFFVIIHYLRF